MSTSMSLPNWIETPDLTEVPPISVEVTDSVIGLAQAAGLTTEKFTILTPRGGSAIIIDPAPSDPLHPLAPARTITLLALIRAFMTFKVLTPEGMLLPNGGFAKADWLSAQIELLTEDTRLLFNPSAVAVRVAIKRLKDGLGDVLGREDLIESIHGLGYRFRVWPSFITVILYNICY